MNPTLNPSPGQTGAPEKGNEEPPLLIHASRPAVTRVSRRAVMLAGVFGAALGLVVLMFGFGQRAAPQRDAVSQENAIRPAGPIDSIKGLPKDYTFDVGQASYENLTQAGSATRPALSPQEQALAEEMRQLAELRRKLLEQQLKDQQQALDSPLIFADAKSSAGSSAVNPTTMPTAMAGAFGPYLRGGQIDPLQIYGPPAPAPEGAVPQNHQKDKEAFLTDAAAVEPYLTKPLLKPVSAFELKAGSIIPGALVTAINTDLPGQTIGQVTENVYDTVTGHYLLIPQGSRLLGKYQSLVTNGQNRALVVWQRLIYPNGNSIVLDGMPGTDEAGMAGLQDQVDYHLDKLAEATALTTAIAYGGNLARNPQSSNGYTGSDVIGDAVAQQANRIGEKIIDRELDVQPTITIRAGWPLRVLVNKDMILEPYQP
jgi:type IV secretion system protein TrbI